MPHERPADAPACQLNASRAVAFLASDDARNITGQSLNVDGGIELN